MVDILVPRSTIVCSQRVGHNCRKTNLDKKSHIVIITHQQENSRSLDAALIQGNTRSGLQSTISILTRTVGSHNNGNIKTKLRKGTRTRAACLVRRHVSTAGWDAKNSRFFSLDAQTCNQDFGHCCQASQGKL